MYQVSALKGICEAHGAKLHHVKPHGALYNAAAKRPEIATAIARAVKAIDAKLIFYGLAGSFLISETQKIGLPTASEVFADRTYRKDGTLTPRNQPKALIETVEQSCRQVLQMVDEQCVTATNGEKIAIRAETICIHGDGKNAFAFAKAIRAALEKNGLSISSVNFRR